MPNRRRYVRVPEGCQFGCAKTRIDSLCGQVAMHCSDDICQPDGWCFIIHGGVSQHSCHRFIHHLVPSWEGDVGVEELEDDGAAAARHNQESSPELIFEVFFRG